MRGSSFCFTSTTTTFFLLCLIHQSLSQIVGCDGNNVDCPSKNAKVSGVCSHDGIQDDLGIVSFESKITSEGPLTWTLLEWDEPNKRIKNPYTVRGFYLGSPASLIFQDVTDFGACALSLASTITAFLQTPVGFDDFANFGCNTVMGQSCAEDLVSQVRDELVGLLSNTTYDGRDPCRTIKTRLESIPFPASCDEPFKSTSYKYDSMKTLTNDSEIVGSGSKTQEGCSITTGGSSYNMAWGPDEVFMGEPDSEKVLNYKQGTSAILTLFYNEPWNNASTGPADFLSEPEVHLSCLRKMPTEKQLSGSVRLQANLGAMGWTWLLLSGLLWTSMVM